MLWYKAWLETRWRFIFTIASTILIGVGIPLLTLSAPPEGVSRALRLGSTLLYCFAALFLAGAGINSQTTYAGTSGFHGSMLFTLSLPVSRRRLFLVRAGLGAIQTCVFVVIVAGFTLFSGSTIASVPQALRYGARAIICTMAVYSLSVLLACMLDEMWQFTGAWLCLGVGMLLQIKSPLIRELSPLRGTSLWSYPVTAPMPWAPVITSVALIVVLLYASVLVLQRKEY